MPILRKGDVGGSDAILILISVCEEHVNIHWQPMVSKDYKPRSAANSDWQNVCAHHRKRVEISRPLDDDVGRSRAQTFDWKGNVIHGVHQWVHRHLSISVHGFMF
jgi:hypothetical protein